MDNQNFNDQELSDIMKEIESLEEEFAPENFKKPSVVTQALSELPEEKSVPAKVQPFKKDAEVFTMDTTAKTKAQTAMSFKVEGQMNVELSFEIGGKTVQVEVTEQGLKIEMEGGMTFNLPVSQKKSA